MSAHHHPSPAQSNDIAPSPKRVRQPHPRLKEPEVEEALRDYYRQDRRCRTVRMADLAKRFRLSAQQLHKHAVRLLLVQHQPQHPADWSDPELEILGQWSARSAKTIRKKLAAAGYQRTDGAIYQKLSDLGVGLRQSRIDAGVYGTVQLSKLLGTVPKTIRRYVRRGLLKATTDERGDFRISDEAIREFARRYPAHFPLATADRMWLLPILTGSHSAKGDRDE